MITGNNGSLRTGTDSIADDEPSGRPQAVLAVAIGPGINRLGGVLPKRHIGGP
jgi:hypothetical protein